MDGEIILNRNNTNVMKLDDNEQALMNEIEIDIPRPQPVKKQIANYENTIYTTTTQIFQEDIDSFANPNKQHQPSVPPPEAPLDYREYEDEPEMGTYGWWRRRWYMMEEEEKTITWV